MLIRDKGVCALQIAHFRIPVGTINVFRGKDLKFDYYFGVVSELSLYMYVRMYGV